ncbi:hypothetical protein [Actinoplanes derwentensis]|nr:hypothetical protein [Actinoplanes derwentensis]
MALIYHLLTVELLLLATAGPGLLALVLLDRDPSNLPLAAACALPAGPALSAALYALHHGRLDLTDLRPAALFWRGYRRNARDVLPIWAIWLLWITVLTMSLANLSVTGLSEWWVGPLALIAVAATLWALNALLITALFAFRTRDVARLAAHFLVRTPGVTAGSGCLLVLAVAAILLWSEAVLALLGSVFLLALLHNCRPMIATVRHEFTE